MPFALIIISVAAAIFGLLAAIDFFGNARTLSVRGRIYLKMAIVMSLVTAAVWTLI